jgi:poly(hydroxyalkanoate) granule-associated protein
MAAKKKTQKKNAEKSDGKAKSSDILRRPFLISVGALALAEERATEALDSLIKKGEKARKAGEKYMKELEKDASKATGKTKNRKKKKASSGEDLIESALHWLNIPTRDEIAKLNKKVDALMKKRVA